MNTWKFGFAVAAVVCVLAVSAYVVVAAPDADPSNPQGQTIDTSTIRWTWWDNSSNEDGFEIRDGSDGWVADAAADATSFQETGLLENTDYTRRVLAYDITAGSETEDQSQTSTASGNNYTYSYGTRRYGQTFTPTISGLLTKVDFYGRKYLAGSLDPTAFVYPTSGGVPDTSGGPLAEETITGMSTTTQWYTVTFSSPPTLKTGTLYAVVFGAPSAVTYNHRIYYGSGYTGGRRVYATTTTWTTSATYDIAFRTYMIPQTRNYSNPTADVVKYTAVHDPTVYDFTLSDDGNANVTIDVVPPPNSTSGVTCVYIERDETGNWSGADYAVITGGWTQTYIQVDSVPYNADWHYRITFRNGDDVQTAPSPVKSITIKSYPPDAPTVFSGTLLSPSTIQWQWTDNSDEETGFAIQDTSDVDYVYAAADATTALETGLSENTEYTRQCRAYFWKFYPETAACTYDGTYTTGGSSNYHRGFIFIPKADIEITKVSRYAGSMVRVHDFGNNLLYEHTFSSTPDATWVEEDLSAPWALSGGVPYRISTYHGGTNYTYYYDALSSVTESADIDILGGSYGSSYPGGTYTSVYGLVNFKYRVSLYSAAGYDGAYYSTGTNAYSRGFQFTVSQDMWVTKLSRLRGTRVTIHDNATEAVLLEHAFSSAPVNEWSEEDVATPLKLENGKTYRISTWNDGISFTYTYEYLTHIRAGTAITIDYGCYGNSSSGQWPISQSSSYAYGVVNFKYATEAVHSAASNSDTLYTPVHEPGDADLLLEDLGSAQVKITVAQPLNHDVGSTGVYIERDLDGDWSGPDYAVITGGWTQVYTQTDTVPSNGLWLYRIKFSNQVTTETGQHQESINIISYPPEDPTFFQVNSSSITTSSITWEWTDNATDEVGYEIWDGADAWVADAGADAESYAESGLNENTQYTRKCVAYNLVTTTSPETTALTYGSLGSGSGTYNMGFQFTPNTDMTITKVMTNRANGTVDVTIWEDTSPTTGILLKTINVTGTLGTWVEADCTPPLDLSSGQTYRMAVYLSGTYYSQGSGVGSTGDLSLDNGCYISNTGFPSTTTATVYGLCNFKYTKSTQTRNYSNASNSDVAYTLVHDPVDADLALNDLHSSGQVEVVVTPPPNPASGQTAVYIERDSDPGFSSPVIVGGDWTQVYTQTDTVPSNGLYYYRITFRNGDGTPTASYVDSIDVIGYPPDPPLAFYGDTITVDSITWHWTDDSSDETGFEVQDETDTMVAETGADTSSVVVSGLSENTTYMAHCHSYALAGGTGSFPDIYPATATPGSNPDVTFHDNLEPISNMQAVDDSLYWSCDRQNFPLNDPQEIWAEFEFDISSTGLSGSQIDNMTFTSKVYFTGSSGPPPLNDPMEIGYIDQAKVQIYNNNSSTWEDMGGDFFNTFRPTIWRTSTEATTWDQTTDVNSDNPIVRTKDAGWSDDYVSADTIKVRVYIAGGLDGTGWEAVWIFDHVKIDLTEAGTKLYSTPTGSDTQCTLVHEPVDADLALTDLGSAQVQVDVTPPPNSAVGSTGVYIERDLDGDWSGADYAVIGGGWTQTYTHTDTVPGNGAWLYRIKFRNQVTTETGYHQESIDIIHYPPAAPEDFLADSATVTDSSITWTWTDKSNDEVGFELLDGASGWIADAAADATSYTETGLLENTSYTRKCIAYNVVGGSSAVTVTVGAGTNSTRHPIDIYYDYGRCQMLYLQSEIDMSGTITKIRFYQNNAATAAINNSTIYFYETDDTTLSGWVTEPSGPGTLVFSGNLVGGAAAGWYEIVLTTPFDYSNTKNLLVSFRHQDGSWQSPYPMWDSTAVLSRCVAGAADVPSNPPSVSVQANLPNVQFEIDADTRNYSAETSTDTIYTAIHDPTGLDFTVTVGLYEHVQIDVTPPNNPGLGDTGVRILRSASADMSGAVIVKDFGAGGYSCTDIVPSGGTWYYAIIFRNAEQRMTARSDPSTQVDVPGPLEVPTGFDGEGIALDTIEWAWDVMARGTAYLLQDESGKTFQTINKPANSYQETVSGENEPATRQLRLCGFEAIQTGFEETSGLEQLSIPWRIAGARTQFLYTPADLGGTEGFINKIYWQRKDAGPSFAYTNVRVNMGHTTLSSLGTSFATNFTELDVVTVRDPAGYTVPVTGAANEWVEITLDRAFYFNGVDNLIVDINVASGGGDAGASDVPVADTCAISGNPGSSTASDTYLKKFLIRFDMDGVVADSDPAGPVTAYSMVRNASTDDFTLIWPGGLSVDITVTEPPNSTADLTGVKIERATDQAFTTDVTVVQAFAATYSLSDNTIPAADIYWYKITYRNGDGKASATSEVKYVVATGSPVIPVADFVGIPTSGFVPLMVDFMDTNSTGDITSWLWDFGDGVGTSTEQKPTYTYTAPADYTVTLTVSGPAGSDPESKVDYIHATVGAPVADFVGAPTSGSAPLTVDFTDLSINWPTSWSWDFGDGIGTSTEQNPTYIYNAAGDYTVTLSVTGPGGTDDEVKVDYISVSVTPPTADFDASPTSGFAPLLVDFTDASTGSITSWSWDFGDGIGTSTAQDPSYTYTAAGTYTVTLTVSGPGGSDDEIKASHIQVSELPPTADFTASPTTGLASLTVDFTDASTGTVTSWSWDFGDGIGTSTDTNPSYTYDVVGDYTVTLSVTGPGGSDDEIKVDYIHVSMPPAPIADFTATPTSGLMPLMVDFTDASTGSVTSWSWDFGDGAGTSTDPNPSYEYKDEGTYTVSLTVTGPGGSDDEIKVDYIQVSLPPAPIADFSATPTTGLTPLIVSFTDLSTGNYDTWDWDFGDGVGTSTEQDPSYTYNTPGTYTVTLTVTGPGGSDDEIKTDYILVSMPGEPTADFSASPTTGLASLTVNFTDLSTGPFDSWAWDFDGDGSIDSTQANPTHTYNLVGVYTVTLTIDGPVDSDTMIKVGYITVSDPGTITAGFSGTPTSGNPPLDVQFTDESVGDISTWSWDFGDGGTSTEQNPTHQYASTGLYTVSLTVTGPMGSDTMTRTSYINVTTGGDPAPAKKKSGGCSCTVDRGPTPLGHVLGYFLPALLLACAYLALRRRLTG